jgi:putative DNA primase/helicase
MRNIDLIREVSTSAAGRWPDVLHGLGIDVPQNPRTQTACPACGGRDRFRFDDQRRGAHFCNQCGAGDGLELVKKVNHCDTTQAAKLVADVLGIDYRTAENGQQSADQDKIPRLKAENQRLEQEQQQQEEQRRKRFNQRYTVLYDKTTLAESDYLIAKGLHGFSFRMLPDGRLLLPLTDDSGAVVAAQTIRPDGEKWNVTDSTKRGAFYAFPDAPEHPHTVILAEGLATALTVHQLRPDALSVAAIDAGNLSPVAEVMRRQHPEAQIIIAADNDWHYPGELDEHGKPKRNTGRIAAEKTAITVSGWVSLPPTEHKADWDDYRQQNGVAAATEAFTESLYQSKGESVSIQLRAIDGGKKGRQEADPLKPHVENRKDGVFWITPKVDKDSGEIINNESWLSAPLLVGGIGEDDNERYLVLRWQPEGSEAERIEALPMRDIGEREGWAKLRAGGLSITAKSSLRAILADHLQRSGNRQMWAIAGATGWQCGAYIMPDGSIIGEPEHPVLFNGRSAAARGYTTKGTAESWRNSVAMLAQGNPSMMLGIACALAAPLIGIAGADGFGVHLFGGSSVGKTTTGNAASSVYGEPEALKLTWYSTSLGLVNEAAAHNDGFMPLDEIGQGSNRRAVAEAAYALFNGVGKIQGAKEGGNRDVKRWRAMAFSTGEIDMESYIRADGGKVNAGQLVRLLNVPISKATVYHGYADGKAHADALRDACKANYGAVGREWIKNLAGQKEASAAAVKAAEHRWSGLLPGEASEQVRRVASRFAILEAALILSQHLTGWAEQDSRDALQHSFNAWVNEFGMGNRESKAWVEQAESFLQRFGYSRYLPYPNADPRDLPIKDLAGYRVKSRTGEEMIFHTWPSVFKDEIAIGANYIAFAQVLADAGMLDKPKKGITKKTLVHEGKQCHFVVMTLSVDDEE